MKKVLLVFICLISFLIFAQDVKKMTFSSSIMRGASRSNLGSSSSVNASSSDSKTTQRKKRVTIFEFSKSETELSKAHEAKLKEIVRRCNNGQSLIYGIECYGEDLQILRGRCDNLSRYLLDRCSRIPVSREIYSDDPEDHETIKIFEK